MQLHNFSNCIKYYKIGFHPSHIMTGRLDMHEFLNWVSKKTRKYFLSDLLQAIQNSGLW